MTGEVVHQPLPSNLSMSVSAESIPSEDAFEQAVWENPDICSFCFQRLKRDSHRYPGTLSGVSGQDKVVHGTRATTDVPSTGEAGAYQSAENPELATYPHRTVCADCGSISGRAPSNPLKRKRVLETVPNLRDRLLEEGFAVNERALRQSLTILLGYPQLQGCYRDVLASATKLSIDHSR